MPGSAILAGEEARVDQLLRHVGGGAPDGCGFGTPDGPCPNPPAATVGVAAAHPDDGAARWLVEAWTPVCAWHRDAVAEVVDAEPGVAALWAARGGAAHEHPPVDDPVRARMARWLERTADGLWAGELGLPR